MKPSTSEAFLITKTTVSTGEMDKCLYFELNFHILLKRNIITYKTESWDLLYQRFNKIKNPGSGKMTKKVIM